MNALWDQLAGAAGLKLSADQHERLSRYLDLLLAGNRRMNLTRIDDRTSAESAHVGDALTVLPYLPAGPHRLAEVGSGGGVPGMILAIARPDVEVTLIESTRKKAGFLRETAAALGLSNVRVLAERAEVLGRGDLRESFDVVVARALAAMDALCEFCLPLVKVKGKLIAMKGPKVREELPRAEARLGALGGGAPAVHPAAIADAENHVIIEIAKIAPTDRRYPRRQVR